MTITKSINLKRKSNPFGIKWNTSLLDVVLSLISSRRSPLQSYCFLPVVKSWNLNWKYICYIAGTITAYAWHYSCNHISSYSFIDSILWHHSSLLSLYWKRRQTVLGISKKAFNSIIYTICNSFCNYTIVLWHQTLNRKVLMDPFNCWHSHCSWCNYRWS